MYANLGIIGDVATPVGEFRQHQFFSKAQMEFYRDTKRSHDARNVAWLRGMVKYVLSSGRDFYRPGGAEDQEQEQEQDQEQADEKLLEEEMKKENGLFSPKQIKYLKNTKNNEDDNDALWHAACIDHIKRLKKLENLNMPDEVLTHEAVVRIMHPFDYDPKNWVFSDNM